MKAISLDELRSIQLDLLQKTADFVGHAFVHPGCEPGVDTCIADFAAHKGADEVSPGSLWGGSRQAQRLGAAEIVT